VVLAVPGRAPATARVSVTGHNIIWVCYITLNPEPCMGLAPHASHPRRGRAYPVTPGVRLVGVWCVYRSRRAAFVGPKVNLVRGRRGWQRFRRR
jgi:hypothetical protein